MSSEWVELCVRRGVAGWRGSLRRGFLSEYGVKWIRMNVNWKISWDCPVWREKQHTSSKRERPVRRALSIRLNFDPSAS